MRSGTILFLSGILVFQTLPELPDVRWGLLLIPLLPAAVFSKRLRLPIIFISGFLWALLHAGIILSTGLDDKLEGHDLIAEGVIASIPIQRERSLQFQFDIDKLSYKGEIQPLPGRVKLSWYGKPPVLVAGEKWQLKIRLKRPHGFMNPGGFDYEGWLFQQGLRATGYVRKDHDNQLISSHTGRYLLHRVRQRLAESINASLANKELAGIITALVIGERQNISMQQWQVLTRTGTNHLVAISGLHVGFVAGLVFFVGRWLWSRSSRLALRWPAPKVAALMALCAAVGYAALAGFSIPTQRALIMLVVIMLSVLQQHQRSPGHVLALALFCVLLYDPLSIMSAGFWLSFAAVAVILFAMNNRLSGDKTWWKWGRVHIIVAIGLLPLMLVLFQQVSLISPVANFIAVPWVSFLVVPLVLSGTLLLMLVPPAGEGLLNMADFFLGHLWPIMDWLAQIEQAQWVQHIPPLWALAPALMGILLLLAPRGFPGRWLGIIWLLPLFFLTPARPVDGELWFTLLDVGQGLASVVQTPNHVLVYDTGAAFSERFNAGSSVIIPFLRHQGINQIDTLVIGHGDNDHIGGAPFLFEEIEVKQIITSTPEKVNWAHSEPCAAGQQWRWDGITFRMIHPPQGRHGDFTGNNASCVLSILHPAGSILLPGDIERKAEKILVKHQYDALRATILVAPHHGSKTSSSMSFLQAVSPEYVLFPVGYRNRYGFPKADILERYRLMGAKPYDSAQHGAIRFKLDNTGPIRPPDTFRQQGRRYWQSR